MDLQSFRQKYLPKIPEILKDIRALHPKLEEVTEPLDKEIEKLFTKTSRQPLLHFVKGEILDTKPLKIGVVFSGGQAPGGHNVIAGIFDALVQLHIDSELFGFLGGPKGIIDGDYKILNEETINPFRNIGGFNLIGSGRDKISTESDLRKAKQTLEKLKLNGLIIVGGDDSNTNAAVLAEYLGDSISVIGVPKTIDGDLKNPFVEVSFGFDTASKTYAEMIGNIGRDALSAKKYYHFIKLMGRSASHIALECALKTEPNLTLIGEEIEKNKQTISEITKQIADLIIKRASKDKHYGLILIPEGLIEFIPEMKCLIKELNELLSAEEFDQKSIKEKLSKSSLTTFESLPSSIQKQLLLERDPHGNVQVAKIQTEELFLETVSAVLSKKGIKFHATSHSFGYEGRAGFPSNFDADYCYSLGILATLLVKSGVTSYMCSIQGLAKPASKWNLLGLPLVSLLNFEMRKGKKTPVIQKNLVDLEGKPFQSFADQREKWSLGDQYLCPGPIQFFGSEAITDSRSVTLLLESE